MWRRTYLFLVLVRLWFALSPSYLHPDENFQGPEVIAGTSPPPNPVCARSTLFLRSSGAPKSATLSPARLLCASSETLRHGGLRQCSNGSWLLAIDPRKYLDWWMRPLILMRSRACYTQAKSLVIPSDIPGSLQQTTRYEASSHFGRSTASRCCFCGGCG
jgi:hypothetical protein